LAAELAWRSGARPGPLRRDYWQVALLLAAFIFGGLGMLYLLVGGSCRG
jgi:hypothetical protein